jgi:Dipeptidyl peptidase IV (DPP IV) N-terminal region
MSMSADRLPGRAFAAGWAMLGLATLALSTTFAAPALAAPTGKAAPAAKSGPASAGQARPDAYRGGDGRIAFVRDGNIYSIEPAGTGLRQLTRAGHASGPRWSPDGKQLAYVYRGNLWVMNANGSGKTQLTSSAPAYTDGRPTWSPNGRYLAFVKTKQHRGYGYLTRYDTVTHGLVSFTDTINPPHVTKIAILAGTAIAWAWARNAGSGYGSFLLYEGTGVQCQGERFCLDALGRPHQDMYRNGYPSAEDVTSTATKLSDPDWFPVNPLFSTDVLTTVSNCATPHCTRSGLSLKILAATILPGAYEGVYAPTGGFIAFDQNVHRTPSIYLLDLSPVARFRPVFLTDGTQPDWQPTELPPNT